MTTVETALVPSESDHHFDCVADDPNLATVTPLTHLTCGQFDRSVSEAGLPDGLYRALMDAKVLTGGSTDTLIDIDALSERMGRKPETVRAFLAQLAKKGWVKTVATVAASGRAVKAFCLAKDVSM